MDTNWEIGYCKNDVEMTQNIYKEMRKDSESYFRNILESHYQQQGLGLINIISPRYYRCFDELDKYRDVRVNPIDSIDGVTIEIENNRDAMGAVRAIKGYMKSKEKKEYYKVEIVGSIAPEYLYDLNYQRMRLGIPVVKSVPPLYEYEIVKVVTNKKTPMMFLSKKDALNYVLRELEKQSVWYEKEVEEKKKEYIRKYGD